MPNEPLPYQLTVKQFKLLLQNAQDNAIIVLRLPAGYAANSDFGTLVNLQVSGETDGPIVIFEPQETASQG